MSGDPEQAYFSDGITEDIITELSRFRGIAVVARHSSFRFDGRGIDVRKIRKELGVGYVLEGSVRRLGDRVRITAQLVDAGTGSHLWAERFDCDLKDLFSVQDQVVRTIVGTVMDGSTRRTLNGPAARHQPACWPTTMSFAAMPCPSGMSMRRQRHSACTGKRSNSILPMASRIAV